MPKLRVLQCGMSILFNWLPYVTLIHLKKWIKFDVKSSVNSGAKSGVNSRVNQFRFNFNC